MKGALAHTDPFVARQHLRREEKRRVQEIRQVVLATTNNIPVTVGHVVEGWSPNAEEASDRGVVVGWQTRLGKVSISQPRKHADGRSVLNADGNIAWSDEDDVVQGIVQLRKNEDSLPALSDVKKLVKQLNESGQLLPGVQIEPYYDRTDLIHITTETVRENLILGMVLVIVILFMFLSNVRCALIVAINIPLALLFAFSVLFLRGRSANLLSIGAVDFGIIVDASVIMVENIYRHLSSDEKSDLPLWQRILHACKEVQGALLFSTAIMVCAFVPLFTMQGPEGQIFGPMADTYAFALGGALLLAVLLCPLLCLFFFRNLKPAPDNFLVRWLKRRYLTQLERCLNHRWIALGLFGALILFTMVFIAPRSGANSCPSWKKATCGSAERFRKTFRSKRLRARCAGAGVDAQVSGGRTGGVADRPTRQRHRPVRLFQCRVLRPAPAAQRLAERETEFRFLVVVPVGPGADQG